ncbi:MAG: alpha/beta hydrolase, partial [Rhodospirillales bacterium]|nr:alpha/beta hydrolase [Rhodospirillales bacterium]
IGSPRSHRHLAAAIARAAGIAAVVPEYRLAPENAFPAAVDDALAVYRAVLDGGVAPARVAIAGDSAGGGLTVALMLAARAAGLPMPAAGVCISPWTDMTAAGASHRDKADVDPLVKGPDLARWRDAYLAGADTRTPLASPLHADLAGLPPLLIQVGGDEVLLDDSRELALRAKAAGIDARLEEWPGMIHVWHWYWPMLAEGGRAIDGIGAFLRGRLAA